MVRTENFSTPIWANKQAAQPVVAAWQTPAPLSPTRAASRPKIPYRPRGHIRQKPNMPPAAGMVTRNTDASAFWVAFANAQTQQRRGPSQKAILISGSTALGVGIVLGGIALWQTPAADQQLPQQQVSALANPTLIPDAPASLPRPSPIVAAPVTPSIPNAPQAPQMPQMPARQSVIATPPQVLANAPSMASAPATPNAPVLAAKTDQVPAIVTPRGVTPPAAPVPATCTACTPPLPTFGAVRFDILVNNSTSADVAAITSALATYDLAVRTTDIALTQSQVRFYRAQDAANAAALASRYNALVVDLTWVSTQSPPAKIDVILAD